MLDTHTRACAHVVGVVKMCRRQLTRARTEVEELKEALDDARGFEGVRLLWMPCDQFAVCV
jgi:hypothetical protein